MAYVQRRTAADGAPSWRVGWRVDGRQTWSPPIADEGLAESVRELVETVGPVAAMGALGEAQRRAQDERLERRNAARVAFVESVAGVELTPWQRRVLADSWPE